MPANAAEHLAERLLRSLEAGLASGGEEGPVHSAALIVYHQQDFPLVNLRVDWDDENPIKFLRKLWEDYRPQMGAYLQRAIDPHRSAQLRRPGRSLGDGGEALSSHFTRTVASERRP